MSSKIVLTDAQIMGVDRTVAWAWALVQKAKSDGVAEAANVTEEQVRAAVLELIPAACSEDHLAILKLVGCNLRVHIIEYAPLELGLEPVRAALNEPVDARNGFYAASVSLRLLDEFNHELVRPFMEDVPKTKMNVGHRPAHRLYPLLTKAESDTLKKGVKQKSMTLRDCVMFIMPIAARVAAAAHDWDEHGGDDDARSTTSKSKPRKPKAVATAPKTSKPKAAAAASEEEDDDAGTKSVIFVEPPKPVVKSGLKTVTKYGAKAAAATQPTPPPSAKRQHVAPWYESLTEIAPGFKVYRCLPEELHALADAGADVYISIAGSNDFVAIASARKAVGRTD